MLKRLFSLRALKRGSLGGTQNPRADPVYFVLIISKRLEILHMYSFEYSITIMSLVY